MPSTPEQEQIIESDADFLRVTAFAGTGKTTTLVEYAKRRPREKMLYLAFNQAIKKEAMTKFPANVKCVTSHGLAYALFGVQFQEANKLVPKIRVNEVVAALDLGHFPEDFRLYVADAAMRTLDRFMASDAMDIQPEMIESLITPGSGVQVSDIQVLAEKLWSKMCDTKDASIGMVHDGYLKLYHLSQPTLRYGTILFDEAQDANPVTAALVEAQQAKKIVVGDGHQQLYSFRGATNAMKKFNATETLYLTKSFRFGQGIADVANLILGTFKNERRTIQGTATPTHIGQISRALEHTVIARANGTLFDEAAQAIAQGRRVHFVGGIGGYRIGDALDAYNLWSGNRERVVNPFVKSFKEFDRMLDYAGAVDDKELKSLANLVKRHGSKLPRMVAQIRAGTVEESKDATVILTTAHKSKGLEWNTVRLADDFTDLLDDHGRPRKLEFTELEEANIIYVAATRAKKSLCPFPELDTMIANEKAKAKANAMPDWARPVVSSQQPRVALRR